MALAAFRELRALSLRDLLRSLLLLLSDRLESGGGGRREGGPDSRASSNSQHGSSKGGPLLGSMGSSLKTALFHSFKDLDDLASGGGGGDHGGMLSLGDEAGGLAGLIPQRNAGLGKPSTKMGLVVAYREKSETLSSLTKQKVRRMMHYQVPLKPFEATIVCQKPPLQQVEEEEAAAPPTAATAPPSGKRRGGGGGGGSGEGAEDVALFPSVMCTPQVRVAVCVCGGEDRRRRRRRVTRVCVYVYACWYW